MSDQVTDDTAPSNYSFKGGLFLAGVTATSLIFGFSTALTRAKKKDSSFFLKGMSGTKEMPESGTSLAIRALGRATLYSVAGVTLLSYSVWKLMGVKNMHEFREKIQSNVPKVPKNKPEGRSDFNTVRELVNHIIDEDNKEKVHKKT